MCHEWPYKTFESHPKAVYLMENFLAWSLMHVNFVHHFYKKKMSIKINVHYITMWYKFRDPILYTNIN